MNSSSSFGRLLTEDAYSLTTLDMLECHAAILTEFHVSQMLAAQPKQFDPGVVGNLLPLFRIPAMPPQYGKPLRVLQ